MQILNNSLSTYIKLFPFIKKKRKLQIYLSVALSTITSLFESISVGLLFPFIASVIEPEKIYNIKFVINLLNFFDLDKSNLTLFFACIFIFLVILTALLKIILIRINTKISYPLVSEICMDMFNKIISQPYHLHLDRNSSDVVATVVMRSKSVGETTFFLISIFNSLILSTFIIGTILLIAPFEIINILFLFTLFYFLIFKFVRKKIKSISSTISHQSGNLVKSVQESLGSIREILIYKAANFFVPRFKNSNFKLREAEGDTVFVAASPGPLSQSMVIIGAIIFAYYLNSKEVLVDFLPILSAVTLGVLKLVPSIQTIFSSFTSISGLEDSLNKTAEILCSNETNGHDDKKDKDEKLNSLKFDNEIKFNNVNFSYPKNNNFRLSEINFKIKKGSTVGIKGVSGSGKSTLIDLLLGLLKPSNGEILLDDKPLKSENMSNWQDKLAFVSQNIFLTDESISRNIALSNDLKEVDIAKINQVIQDVNLSEYINKSPVGINLKTGERGSNLSSGQIQRLGIARALYKNKEIIILDEATNALDKKNENFIFETLNKIKGLTLIFISHNEELIKRCDQVLFIKDGKLNSISQT